MTKTYVIMEVSDRTYEEIYRVLEEAQYDHCFEDDSILLDNISLVRKRAACLTCKGSRCVDDPMDAHGTVVSKIQCPDC